ncbi:COBRA-like protein 2 isoform X1 [Aristolochia californica]|uniref:COBRA-like protein 2 isoform X1 n=1 Tax=Aristolochia californica TaxID=171875 RepID=UPI0035D9568D
MEKFVRISWPLSWRLLMGLLLLVSGFAVSEAYDTMDPHGNITIKWDVMEWHDDRYTAVVTIYNYQLYRHIDHPGWRYEWAWPGEEVIWNMWGAEATEQGNCSKYRAPNIPHSCEKKPVVVDFLPGVPYNQQVKNCCKGGVLSTMTQDPTSYAASFQIDIGTSPAANSSSDDDFVLPQNHSLGLPGYTCGPAYLVPSTTFTSDGRRFTRAVKTWNVTCTYSQYLASPAPKCCVSLSSFYNNTIVQCPICSCGCRGAAPTNNCVEDEHFPSLIQTPNDVVQPSILCTNHMCPIRVHWHVKLSYRNYWRVKVTIANFNYVKNYTEWNLVIQHPNLLSLNQVFSFNYRPLNQYGLNNDTGMFWGIKYYNDMLLQAGKLGNVQTEILMKKDPGLFTFNEGWAFPRKISFNGDECVMPPPDDFPRLPNASLKQSYNKLMMLISVFIFLILLL